MTDEQYCSYKAIIQKMYSDFNVDNSSWEAYALEWIGGAIEEIGTGITLTESKFTCTIYNSEAMIPWFVVATMGIKYEECRLPKLGGNEFVKYEQQPYYYDRYATSKNSILESYPFHVQEYYLKRAPGYLHFSFEEGEIEWFYKGITVDCDGNLLIPNNEQFKEAIAWRVLMKLLARGYRHPIFDWQTAKLMWEEKKGLAIGLGLTPNPEEWDKIMNDWNTMIPNNFKTHG